MMEVAEQELKRRYEALETSELIKLYREGNLTEAALSVIKNVLAARNAGLDDLREQASLDQGKTSSSGIYHPWRRFFARTADLAIVGSITCILFLFIFSYLFPGHVAVFVKTMENPISACVIFYLLYLPVEAAFLATIGTTPAKWVFGIRVLSSTGDKLSYLNALERAFHVWVKGEGLGIPLIIIFTRFFAYCRLTKTGATLWDTSVGSVVTHKKWGVIRATASVLVVWLTIVIMGVLNSMRNG